MPSCLELFIYGLGFGKLAMEGLAVKKSPNSLHFRDVPFSWIEGLGFGNFARVPLCESFSEEENCG